MTSWEEISRIFVQVTSYNIAINSCHDWRVSRALLQCGLSQMGLETNLIGFSALEDVGKGSGFYASFLNGPLAISPSLLGAQIYGKPGFEDPHITSYYGFQSELPVIFP